MIIISCVVPMPVSIEENISLYIEERGHGDNEHAKYGRISIKAASTAQY